jgi:hypothetical protein
VTRRQRTDLALLLIIRRAERDAWVRDQSPVAAPDALTAGTSPSTPASAGPADGRHLHSRPKRHTGAPQTQARRNGAPRGGGSR